MQCMWNTAVNLLSLCAAGLLAEAPSNESGGFFDKVKEAFTPEPAVKQAETLTPPRPAQTAPEQADAAEATPNPVDEPYSLGNSASFILSCHYNVC